MPYESLMLLFAFLLMSAIGIGPALWLTRTGERNQTTAFYIAPSVGIALISLLGFPLVRYLAPTQTWAPGIMVGLVVLSALLVALFWKREGTIWQTIPWRRVSYEFIFFVLCLMVLAAPLLILGIQYAIFRSNSSDAFVYMSLAETTRVADWATIQNGVSLTHDNLAGLTNLAAISPTSLFTARLIGLSFSLNYPISLGWLSSLANTPIYRFFYAYNLLGLACAVPTAIAIGTRLGLNPVLNFLSGAAIALGFWARFILETDAGGEIATLPFLLLVVLAWIEIERHADGFSVSLSLLLAIGVAAIICINFPVLSLLIGAMGIYYSIGLARRLVSLRKILYVSVPFLLSIGILLSTGQLDYIWGNTLRGLASVSGQAAFTDFVVGMLGRDRVAGLWGMSRDIYSSDMPSRIQRAMYWIASGSGLVLSVLAVTACFLAYRQRKNQAERIVVSMVFAAAILFVYFMLSKNNRAAGKAFTYAFPYLAMTPLLMVKYTENIMNSRLKTALVSFLGVWLAVQVLTSFFVPFSGVPRGIFRNGARLKNEAYDLNPILVALERVKPNRLLVNVPRDTDWTFAYYTVFALAKYQPYFQSGLVIDNNVTYQNLWLQQIPPSPDYAVIDIEHDYIGKQNLGSPISNTKDLILYRLNNTDPLVWSDQQKISQEREADKELYPTLTR